MSSKHTVRIALACLFLFAHFSAAAHTASTAQTRAEPGWLEKTANWAFLHAVQLIAGGTAGAMTTAIVAFKFRAHGLPLENARLVGQMVSAVQHGQGLSLEPIAHLVNTFRAAHESGIRLNPDGTFAVDWWRLDEATKKLFVATLKRLSGEGR